MDDPKKLLIDSLKQATNILVTVRKNPTIDQLSACIALTLIANEVGKHATAVFSGQIPSMLSFLKPDKTLESNTDSLQDFIISLDKAKADKLRYKVEDTVVKIYITPYRTSLSSKDLEFGQGDFNVDVVVALGVHDQADVDDAITAHGRILHDATVISINTDNEASKDLGSINWVDANASGLSEMIYSIANQLGKDDAIDNQAATALLTGIVAETERFGNSKTTPEVMEIAAQLLIAGANQELVANAMAESSKPQVAETPRLNQLDQSNSANGSVQQAANNPGVAVDMPAILTPPQPELEAQERKNTGELDIDHPGAGNDGPDIISLPSASPNPGFPPVFGPGPSPGQSPAPNPSFGTSPNTGSNPTVGQPHSEDQEALDFLKGRKVETNTHGRIEPLSHPGEYLDGQPQHDEDNPKFAFAPPSLGGTLTASSADDGDSMLSDSMGSPNTNSQPILSHDRVSAAPAEPPAVPKHEQAPVFMPALEQDPAQASPQPALEQNKPSETLIEPLVAQSDASKASPETGNSSGTSSAQAPVEPIHQTLAELEERIHSRHAAESASSQAPPTSAPPIGAMDMPKPASPTVNLPSPLAETLHKQPSASGPTPPPVPPPLPPMPGQNKN